MRLFEKKPAEPLSVKKEVIASQKPPIVDGWSEQELVSVYNAAPVKRFGAHDPVFADVEQTESFFLLLDGAVEITVKWDGYPGRPGVFRRGDCITPLPKSPGLLYCAEAVEPSTIIEITPTALKNLGDKTQVTIYRTAVASTSRINAYIRAVNGEVTSKNALLASYVNDYQAKRAGLQSEVVRDFIESMPRMPAYAIDLAVKLLREDTSVQEVIDGIKRDPSLAGGVLRTVNSAQYGFGKKIESFYHACMILGFNNIYNLILREAVQSAMPVTEDTRRVHTHSCLISMLSYEVATASKEAHAQTAITVGLLHDIGKGVQLLMKRAHPSMVPYVDTFDPARLGADLLQSWGLPERICKIVEVQQQPEFTSPDGIASEYRREAGIMHVAHVLETLLTGQPIEPVLTIYTRDYMALLGITSATPDQLLKERVIPNLKKSFSRLPEDIKSVISEACEAGSVCAH